MRGSDKQTGSLFSYVDLEERVPARHPLRKIKSAVDAALVSLDADFERSYASGGRPSIAPERLMRASLVQILFSIRSERQLMEQLEYNLLFRWFVGLSIDEPVWDFERCPDLAQRASCTLRRWMEGQCHLRLGSVFGR